MARRQIGQEQLAVAEFNHARLRTGRGCSSGSLGRTGRLACTQFGLGTRGAGWAIPSCAEKFFLQLDALFRRALGRSPQSLRFYLLLQLWGSRTHAECTSFVRLRAELVRRGCPHVSPNNAAKSGSAMAYDLTGGASSLVAERLFARCMAARPHSCIV